MDKVINQPAEDIETNEILYQIQSYQFLVPFKKFSLEQKYGKHIENQKRLYDDYIKVKGKPLLVFEDHPVYFYNILAFQKILITEKGKIDKDEEELIRLKGVIGDRTWRYIV